MGKLLTLGSQGADGDSLLSFNLSVDLVNIVVGRVVFDLAQLAADEATEAAAGLGVNIIWGDGW